MPLSDSELLDAARDNAPDAWDTLLKRHQLRLFAYAVELLHDAPAALDVVQETFVAAVRNIRNLRENSRFTSWMFSIAHQKCVQHWRRLRREESFVVADEERELSSMPDPEATDPREMLLQREQAECYFRLLDSLPNAQRSTFLLHVLENFSLEEIACISDVPVGTVKSRLFHAKRMLRRRLEAAHE